MSQQNESGLKAFTAGEDIEAYRRVKLDTGSGTQVVYADATEDAIGITQEKVSSGDMVTVALVQTGRTYKVTAEEALAVGSSLYAADDGKVKVTVSGSCIGKALELATADLEIIETILNRI